MIRSDFAAFVISYNRPKSAIETIKTIRNQTISPALILILDNSDDNKSSEILKRLENKNTIYKCLNGNKGPAEAAQIGLKYLTQKGFKWIFWGDDDDPPRFPNVFEILFEMSEMIEEKIGALGAVGHRFSWKTGRLVRFEDSDLKDTMEVDSIAGNMSLIVNADAIRDKILPDSKLFFGFEELDFCLKLKKGGYKLFVNGGLMKMYRIQSGHFGVKKNQKYFLNYSFEQLWRQYYSTRNLIYIMKYKFGKRRIAYRLIWVALVKSFAGFLKNPAYGKMNWIFMWQAIIDAWNKKMGMTVLPNPKYKSKKEIASSH